MKKLFLFFCVIILTCYFTSCCKGGSGGDASLVVGVFHHGHAIQGATVNIKYDALDFPGASSSNYNDHLKASNNSVNVTFTHLKCGNYYLYATAFDSSINQPVSGGIKFTVKYSDRKRQESTDIPVTE